MSHLPHVLGLAVHQCLVAARFVRQGGARVAAAVDEVVDDEAHEGVVGRVRCKHNMRRVTPEARVLHVAGTTRKSKPETQCQVPEGKRKPC